MNGLSSVPYSSTAITTSRRGPSGNSPSLTPCPFVGIHGIWQGGTNATTLTADWAAASTKGPRTHHGPECPVRPLRVAYYGNLFRAPSRRLGGTSDDSALVDDGEPFTAEEEDFVLEALAAYAPPGTDPDRLEPETLGLGVPYVPRSVACALVAADRRLGRDVGRGLLRFVRQVYRYLGARCHARHCRPGRSADPHADGAPRAWCTAGPGCAPRAWCAPRARGSVRR
nr:hypothetical protein [Streptomyces sp. RLB1-33]QIY75887.1 hypothetical protein HEP84_49855 [Streptomyces sp. RLB1-33]